jgi:hypothetical protein
MGWNSERTCFKLSTRNGGKVHTSYYRGHAAHEVAARVELRRGSSKRLRELRASLAQIQPDMRYFHDSVRKLVHAELLLDGRKFHNNSWR